MLRSLYSAVSGLDVNQKSMDVIGNNIANVNTIGFKEGRAVFQDLMSQTLIGGKTPTDARGGINPRQVGSGAYLAAVDNIFEPGVLKSTNRRDDLAIQGNGLFVLRGEGDMQRYYTRAGDFNFDRSGTLTSPSGYKVQGWMSDPTNGQLNLAAGVGDIILGPAYKVMQAKSSSEINLVGNLDTYAKASVLNYPMFLTQASGKQAFSTMTDAIGESLDLANGETVKIKANATEFTPMAELYDKNGSPLNLKDGNKITFTFPATSNVRTFSLTYRSTPGVGGNDFSTVQEFINAVNSNLVDATTPAPHTPVGVMTMNAGSFQIEGLDSFELSGISGNTILSGIMSNLQGTYTTGYKNNSAETFYIKQVIAGENFNNLSELAIQIENAMNGVVVPNGFKATFLENNFGLLQGEGVQMSVAFNGGAPVTVPNPAGAFTSYTYTNNPTPNIAAGEFHTVTELAEHITNSINALGAAAVPPVTVNYGLVGNKITFTEIGGAGNVTFGNTTLQPVAGGANPNPYLATVFDASLSGKTLDSANPIFMQEIAGKGRIVYTNTGSGVNITGFAIDKGFNGTVFENNIITSSSIPDNSSMSSRRFLGKADENANVVDLFSRQGESFNFIEGESSLLFNASIGGSKVTNNNVFNIQVGTTVLDLMTAMEEYIGLGKTHNSTPNIVLKDGGIVATGEPGQMNGIDFFRIESAVSKNNNFTKYMTAEVKQAASGGYYPTNVEIYDEQGNKHDIKMAFSSWNQEQNEWRLQISTDNPTNSVAINGATTSEMIIKFNPDGSIAYMYDRFTDPNTILVNPSLRFTAANGTNTIPHIALNLGTPGARDGLTIARAPNGFTTNSTDGYPQGNLEQALFNPAGEIVGSYTNGEVRVLGQLAIALFTNQQGLLKVGDTMFAETGNSGQPTFGSAQTGGRGDINAGMLENSNVDLSKELVSMITTQRGFQASSKIVSTSDEMIQELLSMKR